MNKVIYGLNLIFIGLLYAWTIMLSFSYILAFVYAFMFFTFLAIYLRKSKASLFIPLITFFVTLLFLDTNDSIPFTDIALKESLLVIIGVISGMMLIYRGNNIKIINGGGVFLALLYALLTELLSNDMTFYYSLPSGANELLAINPLFITAAFSTLRSLRTGIKQSTAQQQSPTPQFYQPVPSAKPSPVTFIIRGLPNNCLPIIYINGSKYYASIYYQGDYIIYFYSNCTWRAVDITCLGVTYSPDVRRGNSTPGNSVIITYRPRQTQQQKLPKTPSVPLGKSSLGNWDPNVWTNRTLSVYKVEKVIGEGGNGYVLKANYAGKQLAIKVLKLNSGNPEKYFKELATEASNLVNLSSHKNIVKIYAVNVDSFVINEILRGRTDLYVKNPPMIVMEFMEGGTLKDLLEDDLFYYSTKWQRSVLRAICEIAQALDYIHSQGFVHMDVKPQNIFLNTKPKDPSELDNVSFKLGDLGSAVKVGSKINQLTPEYSPPDVFQDLIAKPHFDIYALGMTAYVLLTRKIDRPDLNEMNTAIDCYNKSDMNCVKTQLDSARMKLMNWRINIDPKLDPLIQSMLSIDPSKRPTAKEVIDMIKKIDPTVC
ncbi:serine/threonine-protein kinase [Sulfurisphaera ohwakuensis]|uniref:serine/threonine-protein kinase n=1 Tax=Sulfurisphaera ohwakuensis TaxID=69656 RepID=UPI0036F1C6AB